MSKMTPAQAEKEWARVWRLREAFQGHFETQGKTIELERLTRFIKAVEANPELRKRLESL